MSCQCGTVGYCGVCRPELPPAHGQRMEVCDCVVTALAAMALDPVTAPGRYFRCDDHGQIVVWDGQTWKWSNQADDADVSPTQSGALLD